MTTPEELKDYCLSLPSVTSDFPFDQETEVFRVRSRMFALIHIHASPLTVNLKCEPGLAMELRRTYPAVKPGYHMNKTHWNTIILDGSLPEEKIRWLIQHSWEKVVDKLPKKDRKKLQERASGK